MQKDKKPNGFVCFLRDKGYYVVLLLCMAAVGVSGFLLLNGRGKTTQENPVSYSEAGTQSQLSHPSSAQQAGATQDQEPDETKSPGKLKVLAPVSGDPVGAYAADFLTYNVTTRDWRTHEGVDLGAELGAEVKAAADGSVYTIYEDESLGTTVVLRHDGGYTTHYANLDEEVAVKVGDSVKMGDVLGKIGQSANIETAEQSHLHFAVYHNNVPVDPGEFLPTG